MPGEHQDLIDVIDRTATIENILNQIIENYCAPKKDRFAFFWDVLLDSSIMPIGSKAKVAMAVAQQLNFKLDKDAIHNLIALRNAFAHHQTGAHPVLLIGKTEADDSMQFELQVISSSGHITRTKRNEAYARFNESYTKARLSLVALLKRIGTEGA